MECSTREISPRSALPSCEDLGPHLRLRRVDKDHRDELETVLDLYLRALGMA